MTDDMWNMWNTRRLNEPKMAFMDKGDDGGLAAFTVAEGGDPNRVTPQYEALIHVLFASIYAMKRDRIDESKWSKAALATNFGSMHIDLNGNELPEDEEIPKDAIPVGLIVVVSGGMTSDGQDCTLMLAELQRRAPGAMWAVDLDEDEDMRIVCVFVQDTPIHMLIDDTIEGVEV